MHNRSAIITGALWVRGVCVVFYDIRLNRIKIDRHTFSLRDRNSQIGMAEALLNCMETALSRQQARITRVACVMLLLLCGKGCLISPSFSFSLPLAIAQSSCCCWSDFLFLCSLYRCVCVTPKAKLSFVQLSFFLYLCSLFSHLIKLKVNNLLN